MDHKKSKEPCFLSDRIKLPGTTTPSLKAAHLGSGLSVPDLEERVPPSDYDARPVWRERHRSFVVPATRVTSHGARWVHESLFGADAHAREAVPQRVQLPERNHVSTRYTSHTSAPLYQNAPLGARMAYGVCMVYCLLFRENIHNKPYTINHTPYAITVHVIVRYFADAAARTVPQIPDPERNVPQTPRPPFHPQRTPANLPQLRSRRPR